MLVLIGAFALVALVVAMIAWPLVSSAPPEAQGAPDGAAANGHGPAAHASSAPASPAPTASASEPASTEPVDDPLEAEIARRRAALSARRDETAEPDAAAEPDEAAEPDAPDGPPGRAVPASREER